MKRTIEIFLQPPVPGRDGYNRIPEKTIDSIVQKFPDFELKGYLTSSINARANEGDEKIKNLISELWSIGKRPVIAAQLMSREGTLIGTTYCAIPMQNSDPDDLCFGNYIQLVAAPENGIGSYTRSPSRDGSRFWFLSAENLNPAKRFGYLNQDLFGCSESFRKELENAAFVGADFTDPPLHPNPDFHPSDRLYCLTSTIVLPPIKNSLYAHRSPGDAVPGIEPYHETDGTKGCYIGPEYRPPTLRFDSEELCALGEFDIARTLECFGDPLVSQRPKYVVSQRFRRWLDAQGLECTYHPIRLENPGDPAPDPPLAAICRELGMPLANVPG
jgi:hypothetical protein